jgi:hypothetical protein
MDGYHCPDERLGELEVTSRTLSPCSVPLSCRWYLLFLGVFVSFSPARDRCTPNPLTGPYTPLPMVEALERSTHNLSRHLFNGERDRRVQP